MSKVLLICNGEKPGKWLQKLARQADFVLAADGGADAALALGIQPDAVLGDLDSVSLRSRRLLKDTPFIHITRQDNTDLEKSLDWITAQAFTHCDIVGATGGRLDFTIGNILSVCPYIDRLHIRFCADKWLLIPITKSLKFSARKGARCSLIPLTPCQQVTLKGLKYRVKQETWDTLHIGRSLSNEISARTTEISFASGVMLLYIEK